MIAPERVFPESNLPPIAASWGREQQGAAVANRDALNRMERQTREDYKQLNSSVNGAANQTIAARNEVYSMPGGYMYRSDVENIAFTGGAWDRIGEVDLPFVRNKNQVTVFVMASVSIMAGTAISNTPAVFVSLTAGDGVFVATPIPLIDYSSVNGKVYRQAQVTHSASFSLSRLSDKTFTPFLQIWTNDPVAAHPDTKVSFYVYMMYGGGYIR